MQCSSLQLKVLHLQEFGTDLKVTKNQYTGQVTQNQQIETSKDMMKDCQSEEKFFYLKSKSI